MTKQISKLFAGGAAIAFTLPSAALADVSALEVWESLKGYSEAFGQTVSIGSQETSGDALILHDVIFSMEMPEGKASSSVEMLEFRERGDGTVAITMSPDWPFSMTVDPEEGEAVDMAMIIKQSGLSIVASGDKDNISFDYLASEISLDTVKFLADGKDIDPDINFSITDIDGNYTITNGEGTTYTSEMNAGNMTYKVGFKSPGDNTSFLVSGSMADLKSNSQTTLPAGFTLDDPTMVFGGGLNMQGGMTSGATTSDMSFQDGSEGGTLTSTSTGGSLDFSMLDGSLGYGGSVTGVNYAIQSPQIPFPEVTLGFEEVAFSLLMPLTKSDEPKDFGFVMKLVGLEISDMIWGMFDPAQVMPRDPATIILDTSGQANWAFDITDPEQVEAFDGKSPGELHSLSINDLTLSAVGAEITGNGNFTFDNTDLKTFDGLPAPTGSIDMNINGVNGLLDRLGQMGFLPSDQAMGVRMMLGLFARPAGGEDALTSTIEVNGDGSVFANGQQLK